MSCAPLQDVRPSGGPVESASGEERPAGQSGGRIEWIDYARGMNIIMVVMGHAVRDAVYHPSIEAEGVFHLAFAGGMWDAVYFNFRMPFFFFLSGMFAERLVRRDGRHFLHDRVATLVYPYILWSALQILVPLMLSRVISPRLSADALWWLWATPVMHFWFLYALFFVSTGYWLVRKAGLHPALIALAGCGLYLFRHHLWTSAWPASMDILMYFPFYALGGVASLQAGRIKVSSAPLLLAIAATGIGVCITCARMGWEPAPIVQLAVTISGITSGVALSALVARIPFASFLRPLGSRSLEIYVAHWFAISVARNVLMLVFRVLDMTVHAVVATIVGVVGPVVLGWACRRLGLKFVFHLPKPPKPARAERSLSAAA